MVIITSMFVSLLLILCYQAQSSNSIIPNIDFSEKLAIEPIDLESDLAIFDSDSEVLEPNEDTIAIHLINPGYNTAVGKNEGELIELMRLTDKEIALDGLKIVYIAKPSNSGDSYLAGKPTILYEFPEGSKMVGDSVLLRYAESPEVTAANNETERSVHVADLVYDTSLAMNGSLVLLAPAEVEAFSGIKGRAINTVCWIGGEDCLPYFSTSVKSRSFTSIIRDDLTGEYHHTNDPELLFDPGSFGLYLPPETENESSNEGSDEAQSEVSSLEQSVCYGLIFSEIFSYYENDSSEQYIELYNSSAQPIALNNCALRYKNKTYSLPDEILESNNYYAFYPNSLFLLTKNPSTFNKIEIIDSSSANIVVDNLEYPHGQKKSASYAMIGYDSDGMEIWQVSFRPTPGEENILQEFKSCPVGKVINELTGNCVNMSTMSSLLKDCGEGKYRNPETGRCKSYNTSGSDTKECDEGYERNPETGRCRKIKNNNGAEYPIVPTTGSVEQGSFYILWIIIGVGTLGIGYVLLQYRKEISYICKKAFKIICKR